MGPRALAAVIGCVSVAGVAYGQQDLDPAARICEKIAHGEVRDIENRYSNEQDFNRLKTILKQANLQSYQELEGSAGSLGIDLPVAKGILGLDAGAETNSAVFQKQMNEFYNMDYSEASKKRIFLQSSSKLNSLLLTVTDNCNKYYFATLRDRVRLVTIADLIGYDVFLLSIAANIPADLEQDFIIRQIEPSGLVKCTEGDKPAALDVPRRSRRAVLTCRKDPKQAMRVIVRTNSGTSNGILIPAEPPPTTVKEQVSEPTIVEAVWTAQPEPAPMAVPCTCLKVTPAPVGDEVTEEPTEYTVTNDCNGQLIIHAYKRGPATGTLWSNVTLGQGQSVVFNFAGSTGAGIANKNCPG
ncbi:MAG TPA: hypothetical protein VIG90_12345 [Pedomonas sp.]|uniref:hypothetical protein n=1 Tax=Pedomonas sp. TaxID=2976421 RepID=UPI002F42E7D4